MKLFAGTASIAHVSFLHLRCHPCSLALRVFFIFVAKFDKQAVDGCQATGFIKMLFDFLKSYINIFIKKGL